jgi:hypothetical protein
MFPMTSLRIRIDETERWKATTLRLVRRSNPHNLATIRRSTA